MKKDDRDLLMIFRPTQYDGSVRHLSISKLVTEVYQGPDPRRRKFLMALAAALLAAQTFTDTLAVYEAEDPGRTIPGHTALVDAKPPVVVKIVAEPAVIPVANRHLVPVRLNVTATDDVDWRPACRIESVSSNHPPQTSVGDDWTIMGPLELYVRAERPSARGHREYTISVRCTDRAGKSSDLKQVKVPVAPSARRG